VTIQLHALLALVLVDLRLTAFFQRAHDLDVVRWLVMWLEKRLPGLRERSC
jgi:hypothetical protein